MSSNKSPNFFEPKTIMAFVLTVVIFILWQNHMKDKYPHIYSAKSTKTETSKDPLGEKEETLTASNVEATNRVEADELKADQQNAVETKEKITYSIQEEDFKFDNWSARISSLGLSFKKIILSKYKERDLEDVSFRDQFTTYLYGSEKPIPFKVTREGNKIEGEFTNASGIIKKTLTFNIKDYSVDTTFEVTGNFPGLSIFMELPIDEDIESSFLRPALEKQEFVVISSDGEDRDLISSDDFSTRSFNQVNMISLGTQFFAEAIVDRSNLKPSATIYVDKKSKSLRAYAKLDYVFSNNLKAFNINQTYFSGPKDDTVLAKVDPDLSTLINFGMFEIICRPILGILKFFYSIFSNYGIAIILLTLLMRILVFPIAYKGYMSMNKMQKIQPLLKSVKEKYKDEPQKANLETMALMKEHKVNPVGGCLPMLLQLPIFFAFYRVLSESIVMYQAPFALWINDLSLKDPYYILPVLMGVTMFAQQKLTPTALEPLQQKMMLFMPLIFSFFMISLPSALTLYIFVSTLFGVLQQYLFTKSKA